MNDLKRPVAFDEHGDGAILVDIAYDRSTDMAVVGYTTGERILFPDCSRYEYGFCLVVEENLDGTFGTKFANMDDEEIDLHLAMAFSRQDGIVTDEQVRERLSRVRRRLDHSYMTIGIPATFRRLRQFVLPHIHVLPEEMLAMLAPGSITRDIISRLEVGDHAFSRSVMIRKRRR